MTIQKISRPENREYISATIQLSLDEIIFLSNLLSENADICKGNKKRTNLHRMFYLLHELASTGYIDSIATDLLKSINRLAYGEDKDTEEGK